MNEQGTTGEAPAASEHAQKEDLLRVNDLGIAYLLQDDPVAAEKLFDEVTVIDANYADGWVNVARARFQLQDFPSARKALRRAFGLKPAWGKAAYFEGLIFQAAAQFRLAERSFEMTLAQFPNDRAALRGLAKAQWEQERPAEALATLDRLFEINPEDAAGWLLAVACYKDLGDEERLASATQAYRRFKPDDTLPSRRGPFLRDDPNLQRLERRIHYHRQAGVDREK